MRIGIYTHYAHCDEAYLCLRLADFLRGQDVECSIYSDSSPSKLGVSFDNSVLHKQKCRYTDWAKQQTAIIWTHPPPLATLNYAKRQGVRTLIVPMWQELERPFRKVMQSADHVVALTTECRELFTVVYKLKNVTLIPFDAGLPIIKKAKLVTDHGVSVFLPWFDRNAKCSNSEFLGLLRYLLERMTDISLTVAISSCRFSPAIAKFFSRLSVKTGGRIKLVRNVAVLRRPALYTAHDLTIYPAECDNYGLCGLTSINCGTPVLSFNLSPQADFLYPDSNGVLVKTKIDYDENGVPHASADYELFLTTLQNLVAEPRQIDNLNKRVNYNLTARKKSFVLGWQTLLRLV